MKSCSSCGGKGTWSESKNVPCCSSPQCWTCHGRGYRSTQEAVRCIRCQGSGWVQDNDNSRDQGTASGGCFITTACCEYFGLPDNCRELTVLRNFRDNYMADYLEMRKEIESYYNLSPRIVESIQSSPDSKHIYFKLYKTIRKAVDLIEDKEYEAAYKLYKIMVLDLQKNMNWTES